MIRINEQLIIDETALSEQFIRAAGPGGQNVNKVATAVQLRFATQDLPEAVRSRLRHLAGRRLTQDGILVITAQRHRTRERNREDALARLVDLLQRAATPVRPRRPTRPTLAARDKRLTGKARHAALKLSRRTVHLDD